MNRRDYPILEFDPTQPASLRLRSSARRYSLRSSTAPTMSAGPNGMSGGGIRGSQSGLNSSGLLPRPASHSEQTGGIS